MNKMLWCMCGRAAHGLCSDCLFSLSRLFRNYRIRCPVCCARPRSGKRTANSWLLKSFYTFYVADSPHVISRRVLVRALKKRHHCRSLFLSALNVCDPLWFSHLNPLQLILLPWTLWLKSLKTGTKMGAQTLPSNDDAGLNSNFK